MPYWNDPVLPSPHYRLRKWTVAGLSDGKERFKVAYYDATYGTRNSCSPHKGAIQIQNSFLIHSGPPTLEDSGWEVLDVLRLLEIFPNLRKISRLYRE